VRSNPYEIGVAWRFHISVLYGYNTENSNNRDFIKR